jgi:hypothetical protein
MEIQKLGQIAYQAYGNWLAWKTPDGKQMATWSELPTSIKNAWTAAIARVEGEIRITASNPVTPADSA